MRSSKNRSRSKSNRNNNNRPTGNIINRVFDSSGPEGKVRGTPQQIIDKYNQLARDSQLSGDRVAVENFQQHAEHYTRLLSEAQRELDARREEQERQNRERQAERERDRAERQERESNQQPQAPAPEGPVDLGSSDQPDIVETPETGALVDLPEANAARDSVPTEKPKRARKPRKPKPAPSPLDEASAAPEPDVAE
ncbi:MAG: DUF4167 domain-containing protein [Pseudomonadota bacterium]